MKKIRTTKSDFALFQRECRKWLERLGLTEWRVTFSWKALEEDFAEARINIRGRCAALVLSKLWVDGAPRRSGVKSSALHEVIHLLVFDLEHLVIDHVVTEELKDRTVEALVRRIHHALTDNATRIRGA